MACLNGILAELALAPEQAGYMGDDVMDIGAMALCGFFRRSGQRPMTRPKRAALVTKKVGGHGAVREVCDFILAAQGRLDDVVAPWLPQ